MKDCSPPVCPLCGQANACSQSNASPRDCWCFSVTIPQELLERVPESLRGQACICQQCVQMHYQPDSEN